MSAMQKANRLRRVLTSGKPAYGSWQMFAGTNLARTMASTGIDWICVDCEHGNIADHEMHEAVAAIAAKDVTPIVRIPANEPWMVKRALDTGCSGIVIPLLKTVAEAKSIVSAAKFPPRGSRGFGSPFPPGVFDGVENNVEYLQQANDALLTIIQIETQEALDNVDAIAAIDGVDVLFIGPFDLGNNIGAPYIGTMSDKLRGAIEKIRKSAKEHNKWSAIYCTSGEQAREFIEQGFDMVNVSGDVIALIEHVSQALSTAKGTAAQKREVTGPYGK